jgi:hypothetical protein
MRSAPMGKAKRRVRLKPGVEVDLDNLAADELEEVLGAEGRDPRKVVTLPRVGFLERAGPPVTARERFGRP